ncbi:histidine kinase dimerization/phosphoacceptor domain -containing protein [Jiulongibacter sediminis]|uniref:histidine kinase n=1 Tax=Jiulongibacter sediminis TaxID=1605367 RepID=A0A0P7BC36_9BACT|nr:histidine kinase dimerization/phosphoacceptor domain -containing protein [Jiulongibacter sediminis]KPM48101.1 hypothetical protein AFM12_13040 [Jiulongibacter sediminis]TBX24280.1 hypothetical protein TK44_13050 [Jiulongibacter sediminis]
MKTVFHVVCLLFSVASLAQESTIVEEKREAFYKANGAKEKTLLGLDYLDVVTRQNPDTAKVLMPNIYQWALESKDKPLIGRTMHQQGNLYLFESHYDKAVDAYLDALRFAEENRDQNRIAKLHNALAVAYLRMGHSQDVKSLYERAAEYSELSIKEIEILRDTIFLVNALNTRGVIANNEEDYEVAFNAFQRGLLLAEIVNLKAPWLPSLYSNSAEVILKLRNDPDRAIRNLNRALELYPLYEDETGLEHSYRNLAVAYTQKKEYAKAEMYGKMALEIGQRFNDKYRIFLSHKALYEIYDQTSDYRKALEHMRLYKIYEDSTLTVEKNLAIAEVETRYQTEKKEEEIAQLSTENRRRRNQFIGAGLASVLFLGLAGLALLQNRSIKVKNKKIEEQSGQLKTMMRELHHRVKNNLAIVSSLLKIQSNRMEDETAVQAVLQGRQRVDAMSLIHQGLYHKENVSQVNMKQYIGELCLSLMTAYGFTEETLKLYLEVESEELEVDVAMPLGLIINELVTNAFKYAFTENENPVLSVSLKKAKDLTLTIQDNGPGVDVASWQKRGQSFGKQLVNGLTRQLGGKLEIESQKGTRFTITIPANKLK